MLADTIEAAVRSMKDPTPKAIDQFIERLIRGKLEDGQLSDCPLSLGDIDQICSAFSGILKGVYHERIEYPKVQHYAVQNSPKKEMNDSGEPSSVNSDTRDTLPNEPSEHSADTPETVQRENINDEENKSSEREVTDAD